MIEVYINGSLVDLPEDDIDFGIDYGMFNVNDITNRSGTRSYTLELPITDRNRIALESSEMLNNLGELPYRKIPAKVFVDGVDIKISFCALRTVKDGYNVELYGGNSDLFYDLGNLEMRNLDLREWNHFWTFDNVVESRLNTEGYIYPLVHCIYPLGFAADIASGDIRTDLLVPFFFVDTILEKIFSELGVTFVNEIASEQWYQDNPIIITSPNTTKDNAKGRYSARFGLQANTFTPTGSFLISEEVVSSDFNYFTNETFLGNYGQGYVFVDNSVTLNVSGKLFFENPTAPQNITLQLRANGDAATVIETLIISVPVSSGGGVADAEVDFQFQQFTTANSENENYFQIFITGSLTSESYQAYGSYMDVECVSINDYSNYLNYNTLTTNDFTFSYITAAQMMPDVSQAQFVKDYCQMFGLIVVYNELINEVRFVRMDKILSNIGNALDWSNKIDLSENAELSFINESYAKRNLFKYADESDETKPTGTDGVIEIDNENLENEKEIVQLSYSATNTFNQVVGSDTTRFNYMKVHERADDGTTVTYSRYNNTPNPRILFLQKKTSADLGYSPNYTDDIDSESVTTEIPLTWFIQTGDEFSEAKEYNLGFDINLLSKNYQLISEVIGRNKTLALPVRLTASDINQLDFTIPIYLSKYESYFYINKIQGYAPGANESTIVELVKLNL